MYTGLLHAHHWLRYIALALIVISVVKAIMNRGKKGEGLQSMKLELYTLISFHLQLIIGFILFFVSNKVAVAMSDMGTAMKDPELRLALIEHPVMMVLGIILVTIGYMRLKKQTDLAAYSKTVIIFYGIATLLILSKIPTYSWGL
jgi:hypothetical protein